MDDQLYILYVEDNEIDVELLKMCIERYNEGKTILIDIAETVEQAKNIFDINKHNAVLIDWNLPDGEGIEVAAFIKNVRANLPVFMLSGALTQEHVLEVNKFEFIEYLEKDYNKSFVQYIFNRI